MRISFNEWKSRIILGVVLIVLGSCKNNEPGPKSVEIKIMTFNVLFSTTTESAHKTIAGTGADIIGLQEFSKAKGEEIADLLDFHYANFSKTTGNLGDNDTGVLSRYPIVEVLPNGVIVEVNKDLQLAVFSVHLSPYPYEPYDFRDEVISTVDEAVQSATQTRMPEITPVLDEISTLISRDIPIFLVGDFNEPSHLDWTTRSADVGLHFEKVVPWPVSDAVLDQGFADSYREIHTDEVAKPGITWTPWLSPGEVYDRIDIVYHLDRPDTQVTHSRRIGGPLDNASIRIEGYESDHFAVISDYTIN